MAARATHDPDLARSNRLLFLSRIPICHSLHFTLPLRKRAGPTALVSPLEYDILEALFEPIKAHDDDGAMDEDGRT